ncbi:putative heme biosynthesis protein [Chitinispirillum alkaliphilum]|nr:putative heme biosynthesis protein [Chitinispirillum alkaliphilum]
MSDLKIPFKKKLALDLYSRKKKAEAKVHELSYLFWECTVRCNLACIHCGSDCSPDTGVPDMPVKHFLNVLENIKTHRDHSKVFVVITGGEPLMRSDLAEAGAEIHRLGFKWGIVTNGYYMTPQRFKALLRSNISFMTISLDGLEDDHDWFRGKEKSFSRAVNAINLAVARFNEGLFLDVVTCVNQKNITTLNEIKNTLISLGVKRWRLATIFPKGRAADNDELKLNPKQLRDLLDFIKKSRKEGDISISYGCEGFLGNYEMQVRDTPFYCRAGVQIGSVLADGSVSSCPSLRADFIQGSIYKDRFMDIWNSRYDVMRNRDWLKTGECKKCKVWRYCRGNGLHLRKEGTGELLHCNYNQIMKAK